MYADVSADGLGAATTELAASVAPVRMVTTDIAVTPNAATPTAIAFTRPMPFVPEFVLIVRTANESSPMTLAHFPDSG
jgi:hypothetical protein